MEHMQFSIGSNRHLLIYRKSFVKAIIDIFSRSCLSCINKTLLGFFFLLFVSVHIRNIRKRPLTKWKWCVFEAVVERSRPQSETSRGSTFFHIEKKKKAPCIWIWMEALFVLGGDEQQQSFSIIRIVEVWLIAEIERDCGIPSSFAS